MPLAWIAVECGPNSCHFIWIYLEAPFCLIQKLKYSCTHGHLPDRITILLDYGWRVKGQLGNAVDQGWYPEYTSGDSGFGMNCDSCFVRSCSKCWDYREYLKILLMTIQSWLGGRRQGGIDERERPFSFIQWMYFDTHYESELFFTKKHFQWKNDAMY